MINYQLVRQRMKEFGMTYDDLAEATQMSRSTIISIINNRSNPTHDSICRIANRLQVQHCELADFFFKEYSTAVK